MNLLASIFGTVVGARNALYNCGALPAKRLQGPVISVGNISVGGSGKTPFVILLGELLQKRGIAYDVLSRGYGRKTKGVAVVDPAGDAREYGDEPLLIARRLGVPVILGEARYAAGLESEKQFGPRLHILDDGFQHRALHRDFDIVLVTPDDARDRLLPAGRLREPLSSLKRADAVVLASGAAQENFPLEEKIVWRVRRGILPERVPPNPVAFCGIARPSNFFAQLDKAGIKPAVQAIFNDHHAYTETDIRDLLTLKSQNGAGGFVTTEKDAINLGGYFTSLSPLTVVPVKMELLDADKALGEMLAKIGLP